MIVAQVDDVRLVAIDDEVVVGAQLAEALELSREVADVAARGVRIDIRDLPLEQGDHPAVEGYLFFDGCGRHGDRSVSFLFDLPLLLLVPLGTALEGVSDVADTLSQPPADAGPLVGAEQQEKHAQDDQPLPTTDSTHVVSPHPPEGGRISRSLPIRRVTLTASRCSSKGMAFLRDVPVNSLKAPMSMTRRPGSMAHSLPLRPSIAPEWNTLPSRILTSRPEDSSRCTNFSIRSAVPPRAPGSSSGEGGFSPPASNAPSTRRIKRSSSGPSVT